MARPSPQTDRVVALVGLLTSSPDATITLADATRRLRVNKSTCHSMLTALTEHAWRSPASRPKGSRCSNWPTRS
jgi:DNA-binding IclR family transcriptional regulator